MLTFNFLKPIFKKGEPGDPDNYRGIAVGGTISKIFSLVILDRLEIGYNKLTQEAKIKLDLY